MKQVVKVLKSPGCRFAIHVFCTQVLLTPIWKENPGFRQLARDCDRSVSGICYGTVTKLLSIAYFHAADVDTATKNMPHIPNIECNWSRIGFRE